MKLTWNFTVDGADLVVRNVMATCFGGPYDSGDNGETESGTPNKSLTGLMQCALPIRSNESATRNSPLAFPGPHIPWESLVMVWKETEGEETAISCILTDNGPRTSQYPDHAIDLNPPAAAHFAPNFDPKKLANEWSGIGFSYRIVAAAKFAPRA